MNVLKRSSIVVWMNTIANVLALKNWFSFLASKSSMPELMLDLSEASAAFNRWTVRDWNILIKAEMSESTLKVDLVRPSASFKKSKLPNGEMVNPSFHEDKSQLEVCCSKTLLSPSYVQLASLSFLSSPNL